MGKIYSGPKHIKAPTLDFSNYNAAEHLAKEKKYLDDMKEFLKGRNKEPYVGETIQFPVADGLAMYMVASLKPVELIHLELGDAWQADDYAKRLNASDIKERVDKQKKINELFSKKV